MKSRSGAGGKTAKLQNRKTAKPKRITQSNKPRPRWPSTSVDEEIAPLKRELKEAREQQAATSEVLRVISTSRGALEPVFQIMLESAARICEAPFGSLCLREGDVYRTVAMLNAEQPFAEFLRGEPWRPSPHVTLGRALATKRAAQTADITTERPYIERDPVAVAAVELGGYRTVLAVPMLKESEIVGAIMFVRQEVRPFTDEQIALVQNFAAQAVIAIENARLLNELRQRTDDLTERTADLTEALEQQTATSEVLQVISSSLGDLQPVFDALLANATRLCEASYDAMWLCEGNILRNVAQHGEIPDAYLEQWRAGTVSLRASNILMVRAIRHRRAVQVDDLREEPAYLAGDPLPVAAAEIAGVRTLVTVPMFKDNDPVGIIAIYRREVRAFTDKQIELVESFAAQAVIAIENARLLNELRQRTTDLTERTGDLTEALEQQTASAEVLGVISSSPGNLGVVFQAMLKNATRLCEASIGTMYLREGDAFRTVGMYGASPTYVEARLNLLVHPSHDTALGQVERTRRVAQIKDAAAGQAYAEGDPIRVSAVDLGGIRTVLCIPMLKETDLIGAIAVYRQEVRPFTDKQIALLSNFAAQAVIAIENARLLNELRQSLEEQTATSEVLRVISTSPGELEPVFAAMLGSATRICEAEFGNLFLREEDGFRAVAWHGEPTYVNTWRGPALTIKTDLADIPLARLAATMQRVHVADLRQEAAYKAGHKHLVALIDKGGARTLLIVPMVKERTLVGAIAIYRQEVRPFIDKQIALVENFAAQAVIAIENARLLRELRERTEDVVKLNEQLEQRVTDQVGEIERMGRLRRFLPPQVADLIVASGTEKQLESHRREITALFCDLRGFTGFTESADAEDVMALLRDYHATVGEKIIKYSGTLERYAGDGVMVVFNDPVPVENSALQAVLMALEVRDAIGALTATWSRLGHEIGFGIGIAHGFATLGTIGFEGRFDYAAIGTVSNVASRLCDEAKPGQILISPRVLIKVENAVKVEPVGEFALKGIRRPLAAYNVVVAAA